MEKEIDLKESFDFYDQTYLKTYNLNKSIRYQLNLLDSLDMFTRKHSENVATVTCNLCKKLHCTKGFTEYCVTCAYIHDIGKMFISQNILQKNGKLTDEEFEIMKTHTTLGYQLCLKDKALRPYYAGPYYHHEALDGTGYPQGLLKKDIPYEAQIIRVADEFDAIVSKRQYKSHIGISDTLKILIENSKPNEPIKSSAVLVEMANNAKLGKNNPAIVKVLIKVVIDDIYYEISCAQDYVDYLDENIKRLEKVQKYYNKMMKSTTEDKRNYYLEYMKIYLENGETVGNFFTVYENYKSAYKLRKDKIDTLYNEIKVIKKLKL